MANGPPTRPPGRTTIARESPDSPWKIDAAVCVIGVRMVRWLVLATPAWAKRQKRGKGQGRIFVLTD